MSDLISRQDAIKAIEDLPNCYNGFSDTYDKACIIGTLGEVPSAERKGKWLHPYKSDIACECSVCHMQMPIIDWFHFCPNCGSRNEVSEDGNN